MAFWLSRSLSLAIDLILHIKSALQCKCFIFRLVIDRVWQRVVRVCVYVFCCVSVPSFVISNWHAQALTPSRHSHSLAHIRKYMHRAHKNISAKVIINQMGANVVFLFLFPFFSFGLYFHFHFLSLSVFSCWRIHCVNKMVQNFTSAKKEEAAVAAATSIWMILKQCHTIIWILKSMQ